MTVWIVNPFDNLPLEGNRPQRYWLMARAFAAAGHDVTLWTSDFSHATKRKRVIQGLGIREEEEKVEVGQVEVVSVKSGEGFEVRMIPTRPYASNVCLARIRSHRQLARDFERLACRECSRVQEFTSSRVQGYETPDLIIASTPPLGLCAAAMRVARHCGARFVCDIQDAWPETFVRLIPKRLRWAGGILLASMYRTARTLYREADLVTGVCKRYAELSGRPDFYLAYLGIESGDVSPTRQSGNLKPSKSTLLYLGNLGAGYDLGTVIDAVAKRPELSLDIAGKGPTEDGLRSKVKGLKLENRVRFHGYLGQEALNELLARCGVGVIPMRDDSWVGLPNKMTDYLNAGLRIVSSLHGECGALLERTGFGRTYEWGDADSLLSALDGLAEVSVTLPDELRAESIYPKYVESVVRSCRCTCHGIG